MPDNAEGAFDDSNVTAVLDTNVLLDLFSLHDLLNHHEQLGENVIDDKKTIWRRARVRESFLLAMHFSQLGIHTYSLGAEAAEVTLRNVDPKAEDAFATHYTRIFLYFVRPRVLPNWIPHVQTEAELDRLRGNEADQALVDYAKRRRLPLVTNEGYTPDGVQEKKLRKRARDAGVEVFRPADFYAGKLNEELEISRFFTRFETHKTEHIHGGSNPDIMADSMETVYAYYRHVLCGVTRGRSQPVAVKLF